VLQYLHRLEQLTQAQEKDSDSGIKLAAKATRNSKDVSLSSLYFY